MVIRIIFIFQLARQNRFIVYPLKSSLRDDLTPGKTVDKKYFFHAWYPLCSYDEMILLNLLRGKGVARAGRVIRKTGADSSTVMNRQTGIFYPAIIAYENEKLC